MMYWGYYDAWSWVLMAAMMVVLWGGVAVLIVFAARTLRGPSGGGDPAMDALRRRLASGEISQDEFERTRRALQG